MHITTARFPARRAALAALVAGALAFAAGGTADATSDTQPAPAPSSTPVTNTGSGVTTTTVAGPETLPPGAGVDPVALNEAAAAALPQAVKDKGELTVAIPEGAPPSGFVGPDGHTVVGFDPDFATALGQALGVKIVIQGTTFDQIIPGTGAGRFDLTVASMTPTAERHEVLDFVDYFRTGTNIGVPIGNPQNLSITTLCGRTVAVLKGSIQEGKIVPKLSADCTAAGNQAITAMAFPDMQATILALTAGRVEAVVQSAPPIAWAKLKGAPIDLGVLDRWTNVGIATKRDNGLIQALGLATQHIIDSPSYQQMLGKWGLTESAITEAKVNNFPS